MRYNKEYIKSLKTMGKIFDKAVQVAKRESKERQEEFFTAYVEWILEDNDDCETFEEALSIAKSNFGYFAGYYTSEIYELINKTYGGVHPVFGKNPFNVSPADAYKRGLETGKKLKN